MQLQPNTNADKDAAVPLCGSRDWTDEDAVRAQLERPWPGSGPSGWW